MSDINLLPNKNKRSVRLHKIFGFLRVVSLSLFGVVCLATIVAIFMQVFSPLTSLKNRHESLLSELGGYNNRIAKYLLLQDRMQNIQAVLTGRTKFETTLAAVIKELPAEVSVKTLFIDDTQMTIVVVSQDLTQIDQFIKSVTQKSPVEKSKRVTVHNVAYVNSGKNYTASLSFK